MALRRQSLLLVWSALLAAALPAQAGGSRVKDLVMVAGARDNQLVGYGLVTGLAGDGDKNPVYTLQSIANALQRYGITVPSATLASKNVAAVMVTADIPAFKKPGTRLDVTISSLGDAKSLQGGVLLQTPLFGANGKVYAVAQGALSVGGLFAGAEGGGGATVQKNHPTVAQIIGGALVEQEIPAEIIHENQMELLLREPDFTSSARLAAAINEKFPDRAQAVDATTVRVLVPDNLAGTPVDFMARLEAIEVYPDTPARIIINERTGTIVATSRIRIASCAVSHGNLTISIASSLDVSQPNPLSQTGNTAITPRTDTNVTGQKAAQIPLEKLDSNPHLSEAEKIAEVSRQFEAVLLRQILSQARKTVFNSEFNTDSTTHSIYQDMINYQLAESISLLLPADYQPLAQALVQENNELLVRVQQRARQNHLLLSRSLELMQRFLSLMFPACETLVYNGHGAMLAPSIPSRPIYEAVG